MEKSLETHTLDALNIMTGFHEVDYERLKSIVLECESLKLSNNPLNTRFEDSILPQDPLVDEIVDKIKQSVFEISNLEINLDNMWTHIHDKNMSTQFHNHYPSDISAVYYLSSPEGSGALILKSELNKYSPKQTSIKPKPGMFVIFPGFIDHGVTRNISSEKRISLSFNFSVVK
jgi:hypothetical protein